MTYRDLQALGAYLDKNGLDEELNILFKIIANYADINNIVKKSALTKIALENSFEDMTKSVFENAKGYVEKIDIPEMSDLKESFFTGKIQEMLKSDDFCDSWLYSGSSLGLSIMGLLPIIGVPIDVANGLLNLRCGDYLFAALSFISAIPAVGYIGNALKVVFSGVKGLRSVPKIAKMMANWWKGTASVKTMNKMKKGIETLEGSILATKNSIKTLDDAASAAYGLGRSESQLAKLKKQQESYVKAKKVYNKSKKNVSEEIKKLKDDVVGFVTNTGKYSKIFGISNSALRGFLKWWGKLIYAIEESIFGVDREYSSQIHQELKDVFKSKDSNINNFLEQDSGDFDVDELDFDIDDLDFDNIEDKNEL